jgi:hypothetical protein
LGTKWLKDIQAHFKNVRVKDMNEFRALIETNPYFSPGKTGNDFQMMLQKIKNYKIPFKTTLTDLLGINEANYDVPLSHAAKLRRRDPDAVYEEPTEGLELSTHLQAVLKLGITPKRKSWRIKEKPGETCPEMVKKAKEAAGQSNCHDYDYGREKVFQKCRVHSHPHLVREDDQERFYHVRFEIDEPSVQPSSYTNFGYHFAPDTEEDFQAWVACLPMVEEAYVNGEVKGRKYAFRRWPGIDRKRYNEDLYYKKSCITKTGKIKKNQDKRRYEELENLRKFWREATEKDRSKRLIGGPERIQPDLRSLNREIRHLWLQGKLTNNQKMCDQAIDLFQTEKLKFRNCHLTMDLDDQGHPKVRSRIISHIDYASLASEYPGLTRGPLRRITQHLKAATEKQRVKKSKAHKVLYYGGEEDQYNLINDNEIRVNGIAVDIDTFEATRMNRDDQSWLQQKLFESQLYHNENQMILDYHNGTMDHEIARIMVTEVFKQKYLTRSLDTVIIPDDKLKCDLTRSHITVPQYVKDIRDVMDRDRKKTPTGGTTKGKGKKKHKGGFAHDDDEYFDNADDHADSYYKQMDKQGRVEARREEHQDELDKQAEFASTQFSDDEEFDP